MGRGAITELPDDIEVMPPGPELAGVVSSVDREQLDPDDLLRVAQARLRLIARLEAQLLAACTGWRVPCRSRGRCRAV